MTCKTLNGRLFDDLKILESAIPILTRMKRHGHWQTEFNFEDLGIHGGINFVDPENYLKGLTSEIIPSSQKFIVL